ncbi:MAG: acetate--CoA ligase family protein [Gammaproteobacteria bacterium]|nr:acetate--CoA ligase family protein [Gammaproteobacteria bacterium]
MTHSRDDGLSALFDPKSIAVIGASDDLSKFGARPIRFMLEGGFQGPIYPINPKGGNIQGLKAYADIREIPEPADMVIISVPARHVVDAARASAEAGVRTAVVFSSGFAEVGDEGELWQTQLRDVARESGLRIVGPNCMGMLNSASRAVGTFTSVFAKSWPKVGGISVISQSGAVGAYMLVMGMERDLGLRTWVTTGNEVDVDVSDCVAHCAQDPGTDVIVAYIEGAKKPEQLRQAFETARLNGKPVIVMKVGASEVGAQAANTHTASLAGADAIYDAVFRQYGVYRAGSLENMLDVAQACATRRFPQSRTLGIVTVSGGAGVIASDAAEASGLELPALPEAAQRELKALMPFAAVRNPVDTTAQMVNDVELFRKNLDVMLATGDYDTVLMFLATLGLSAPEPLLQSLVEIVLDTAKRDRNARLVLSMLCRPDTKRLLESHGVLVYEDITRAIGVIGAMNDFSEEFARPPAGNLPALPASARPVPAEVLSELGAADLLRDAGLPMAPGSVAQSADDAVAAAESIGYPVVLKIASPDIQHKSDIGGVKLKLGDAAAVREAFESIMSAARSAVPDATLEGCLVAPMITGGVETILGVNRDPLFGPVVLFGLGGVFVEVLKDVTFRAAPFDVAEAHRMIREVKGYAMLEGVRGSKPADVEALAQALSMLSVYAAENADRLEGIDLNPFLVFEQGRGAMGVDAVVVPHGAEPGHGH